MIFIYVINNAQFFDKASDFLMRVNCLKAYLLIQYSSLIKQLFHPHKLAIRLSKFWISMLKEYSVLTDDQIRWIVKQKIEGKLKNEEIASIQGISVRRVQQIYSLYKKNGSLPVLKKAGRHKASITEEERKVIIEACGQFKSCANQERIIKQKYGLRINHMKINSVLK